MRKIVIFMFLSIYLMGFSYSAKIENLIGKEKFQSYNKLLSKIFVDKNYSIKEIVSKLKDNGLLELFFDKAKIVHTNFIFINGNQVFNIKFLNDSLKSLGYYYFYISEIDRKGNRLKLDIEFKSEHFINPVSFIKEIESRGCNILDIFREKDVFNYKISCKNGFIKESNKLLAENKRYIKAKGSVYWIDTNNFKFIEIRTKKIDFWHPFIFFYDKHLNLLNNFKLNKKTTFLKLKIPINCKYIKITDIYSGENFKRGIIIKGLK